MSSGEFDTWRDDFNMNPPPEQPIVPITIKRDGDEVRIVDR
jgi:hypothetical protein